MLTFTLQTSALCAGGALALLGGMGLFAANPLRKGLDAFPRHRAAAVFLTLLNVTWVAIMVYHAHLGRFEWIKPLLYILAPVTFFAVIHYMDELLAPRMLGGFLLLIAAPVMHGMRWHDSAGRLLLTVLVYVWIVGAMILVLSPYRFRHAVTWTFADNRRVPIFGILFAWGLALIVLALTIF